MYVHAVMTVWAIIEVMVCLYRSRAVPIRLCWTCWTWVMWMSWIPWLTSALSSPSCWLSNVQKPVMPFNESTCMEWNQWVILSVAILSDCRITIVKLIADFLLPSQVEVIQVHYRVLDELVYCHFKIWSQILLFLTIMESIKIAILAAKC